MEIENYEKDTPYWEDSRRKTIVDYSSAVIDMIRIHLNCSLFDSIFVFVNSGIYDIIAQDPEIASHIDPEEWIKNVDAFICRNQIG